MVEFVANYRRSNNISGKLSYSNLYTSISVLAGHYASYGPKFPVPEKRRKRLMQVWDGRRTTNDVVYRTKQYVAKTLGQEGVG